MRKLVLMCDYGLDDAAATLFVLDNRKGVSVDVLTIAGNSSATESFDNARKLFSNYEGSLSGVRIIDTSAEKQNHCNLPSIHGKDGLGDFLTEKEFNLPVITYKQWIEESEEIDLVSLGPCTLTRDILEKRKVNSLLIMGGNVSEVPNFNGYEFNHYLDIPAFEYCVKNYPAARVATLDSCRTRSFNFATREFNGQNLLSRTLKKAQEFAVARHRDNCYVYDYIAVQYIFAPEDFVSDLVTDPDGNTFNQLRYKND